MDYNTELYKSAILLQICTVLSLFHVSLSVFSCSFRPFRATGFHSHSSASYWSMIHTQVSSKVHSERPVSLNTLSPKNPLVKIAWFLA